jgi:hypothetical protein
MERLLKAATKPKRGHGTPCPTNSGQKIKGKERKRANASHFIAYPRNLLGIG